MIKLTEIIQQLLPVLFKEKEERHKEQLTSEI